MPRRDGPGGRSRERQPVAAGKSAPLRRAGGTLHGGERADDADDEDPPPQDHGGLRRNPRRPLLIARHGGCPPFPGLPCIAFSARIAALGVFGPQGITGMKRFALVGALACAALVATGAPAAAPVAGNEARKSTRMNSSH